MRRGSSDSGPTDNCPLIEKHTIDKYKFRKAWSLGEKGFGSKVRLLANPAWPQKNKVERRDKSFRASWNYLARCPTQLSIAFTSQPKAGTGVAKLWAHHVHSTVDKQRKLRN